MKKIALLTGRGDLAAQSLNALKQGKDPYLVVAYEGQTEASLVEGHPTTWLGLGKVGKLLDHLRHEQVTHVVMAGAMTKPQAWRDLMPDLKGTLLLGRLMGNSTGDDGLLRVIVTFLEEEGFKVLSPESLIGQEFLCPEGLLTALQPTDEDKRHLQKGLDVALLSGLYDVGQAVVIQNGVILGIEGPEGTDALLNRTIALKRHDEPGPLLIKILKPGQETRVDRSVVGPETFHRLHQGGFRGIALEAQGVIVLDQQHCRNLADRYGLWMIGVTLDKTRLETLKKICTPSKT
jgi:DUF1009 family protein